jgi:hypothetical protein
VKSIMEQLNSTGNACTNESITVKTWSMLKRYVFGVLIIFFASGSMAGDLNVGVGIGNSYSMVAPFIGYNFMKGPGMDFSLTYIYPGIDFTTGIKYNFALNDVVSIGPKVTLGKRDTRGFKTNFIGFAANTTVYFTRNSFLDFQAGLEVKHTTLKISDGVKEDDRKFLPQLGMAYGYSIGKTTTAIPVTTEYKTNYGHALLTAGQISGVIIAFTGALFSTATLSWLGTSSHGIPETMYTAGTIFFVLGSLDFVLCSRFKEKRVRVIIAQ